jgi:uncharacterized protein (DUF1330 family)
MQAYAVALLRDVAMGPDIVEYLERIDGTLAPFGGHFVIHGGRNRMLEGDDPGTLIAIEFPDRESAEEWYASSDYQAILPLRTGNSDGTAWLVDGVDRSHRAVDVLVA